VLLSILYPVHIIAGACWAGAVFLLVFFVDPAVLAAGAAGSAFMQKLMQGTRFPMAMSVSGGLTVLSGFILYWLASDGLSAAWITSAHGIVITLGAVAGLLGAVFGAIVAKRGRLALLALQQQLQTGGSGPPAALQTEIQALNTKVHKGSLIGAAFVLLALACMALGRAV
jgi:uncharacterized membrane protein